MDDQHATEILIRNFCRPSVASIFRISTCVYDSSMLSRSWIMHLAPPQYLVLILRKLSLLFHQTYQLVMLYVTRLLLFPGIYKQPLEPTMTLRVQTSTHRACLLCVTWRLARVNPFHQTHLSQRPGGYRTQVCCSYWLNQTVVCKVAPAPVVLTPDLSLWLSGAESWPPGVCLKYVGGDQFGHVNMVMVRSLDPQEMADVSVQMQSPTSPGMYQGQWRMCTATGLYYGGTFHPWYLTFFFSP